MGNFSTNNNEYRTYGENDDDGGANLDYNNDTAGKGEVDDNDDDDDDDNSGDDDDEASVALDDFSIADRPKSPIHRRVKSGKSPKFHRRRRGRRQRADQRLEDGRGQGYSPREKGRRTVIQNDLKSRC